MSNPKTWRITLTEALDNAAKNTEPPKQYDGVCIVHETDNLPIEHFNTIAEWLIPYGIGFHVEGKRFREILTQKEPKT